MFTTHSACPTADNPPCVPGTYQVLHPAPLDPVGRAGGICRLSQAAETAKGCRTAAPATGLNAYHQNENALPLMDNGTALMLSSIRRTTQRLWNDPRIAALEKAAFKVEFDALHDDAHGLHDLNKRIAALSKARTPAHQRHEASQSPEAAA
jgi:hypothetical protein